MEWLTLSILSFFMVANVFAVTSFNTVPLVKAINCTAIGALGVTIIGQIALLSL